MFNPCYWYYINKLDSFIIILISPRQKFKKPETMITTKKELIKKMKKEANKAISKVIASTFDTNERNRATLQIHQILADNIKQLENL